ncbi:MAG: hypothetical protein KIT16_22430 [Rhodospirillaceae bacterium]|nr:hypothetical protein [Rhodospirillaceae bacterium]
MLAVLALLFQGAFAIACDVHDLGHLESAAAADPLLDTDHLDPVADATASKGNGGADWHDLFATGHGILQVFETVAPVFIDPVRLPAASLPPPAYDGLPPAPTGLLLRPPIRV